MNTKFIKYKSDTGYKVSQSGLGILKSLAGMDVLSSGAFKSDIKGYMIRQMYMKETKKLFRFVRPGDDIINPKTGRPSNYKVVNVIEKDEEKARLKANLSVEYVLVETHYLGKDW